MNFEFRACKPCYIPFPASWNNHVIVIRFFVNGFAIWRPCWVSRVLDLVAPKCVHTANFILGYAQFVHFDDVPVGVRILWTGFGCFRFGCLANDRVWCSKRAMSSDTQLSNV